MTDDDTAFGEEILNVAKAEMEAKAQPHGVCDDLGRESVAPIERRSVGSATDIRRHLSTMGRQLDNSSVTTPLRKRFHLSYPSTRR